MSTPTETFGEPISVYTRAQAIDDGALVDLSQWGREYGFRVPVCMTRALFNLVDIDSKGRSTYESTRGRAHDVLTLGSLALRGALARKDTFAEFTVKIGRENQTLYITADGDGVTVMLPEDY